MTRSTPSSSREAFHWFANAATLAELARVLRPRGTLAILFNQPDSDFEPPLPEAFWEAYRAAAIEKPPEQTVSSGLWKAPFPGLFEPLAEETFPNPIELDREQILAQAASWSMIGALPERRAFGAPRAARRAPARRRVPAPAPHGAVPHPAALGQPADAVRVGRRIRAQQVVQVAARLVSDGVTPTRAAR